MFLDTNIFRTIVSSTPLISIDLIVQNSKKELLLGKRLNRPAKDFWFVPGGRVYKNEALDKAFERVSLAELGFVQHRSNSSLLGVYEHFYSDSVFGAEFDCPSTHYVVVAYSMTLSDEGLLMLFNEQHSDFSWMELASVLTNDIVHEHTKAYAKDLIHIL